MNSSDNCTDYYDYYDYYDDEFISVVEKTLLRIELFMITPLGIVGNLIIVVVLMQKKNRQYASSVVFTSLAISDNIILLSRIPDIFETGPSAIGCKLSMFLASTSIQLSSVLLAVVASERVLGAVMPHKVKSIFTAHNARIIVIVVALILSACNTLKIVSYDVGEFEICEPHGQLKDFMYDIYVWYDFAIAFAIPFIFISISSVVIVIQIKKISKRAGTTENDRVQSVTRSLLAVNTAFLLTVGPFLIYQIIYPEPPFGNFENALWFILVSLGQVNAAANFFLYFLSGPRFRADTKELLLSCKQKLRPRRSALNTA